MSVEEYIEAAEDYSAILNYKFQTGQTVIWRGGWGTQPPKSARIVDTGEKNGRAVYDLDNGHWAYEYQLEEVCDGY